MVTAFFRRRGRLSGLAGRVFGLLLLAGVLAGGTAGAEVPGSPASPAGACAAFAAADFDGDLRPDLVGVRVGRSDAWRTDYWIQFQLSAAGQQTIVVAAPSGGLQIAVRDVNGDKAPDLVVTTTWLKQPVAILLNDGHGNFSRVDPAAFPEAFNEPETSWGSCSDQAREAVGVPPQPRPGICPVMERMARAGRQTESIRPSNPGLPLNSFFISHLGRAPPSPVQ
jgi:hypothetical protein